MLTLNYYVKDFSEWLPKADRKEEPLALLGNLWSRFEKEVPEESRRDDPAVEESFVRILGHPIIWAAGYWREQRWIEPILFPVVVRSSKLALAYIACQSVVIGVCLIAARFLGIDVSGGAVLHTLLGVLVPVVSILALLALTNAILAICPRRWVYNPFDIEGQRI